MVDPIEDVPPFNKILKLPEFDVLNELKNNTADNYVGGAKYPKLWP